MSRQDVAHHYDEPEIDEPRVEKQWNGKPAPESEDPNSVIKVWQISPHTDQSYDDCIIRDYHQAIKWAQGLVETVMDDDQRLPATIDIRLVEMRLCDFREIQDADYDG